MRRIRIFERFYQVEGTGGVVVQPEILA